MKIVQINATCGIGSTGKICVGISRVMTASNIENYILCSQSNSDPLGIPCSDQSYIKRQALKAKLLGNYGFNSRQATQKMIAELERIQPDLVHLHNIHGHDCNLDLLFSYFKEHKTKLVWTFHDCWAFTGYCTHFTIAKCDKWKTSCSQCAQKSGYSWLFDKSKQLFREKMRLFDGLDLKIVTPSRWLANLVKESFLREYPVHVINNGIDLGIFKPSHNEFRKRHGLEHKKIVLGVSFGWNQSKGLDVFIRLTDSLPKDYQVVLIGTDDKTDKHLSDNILSIHRTQDQRELAEIYSAADVFVNPTREDNFPTVNMEAIACGTPVITFRTGGSPEMVDDTCGSVVECDDIDAMEREILRICTNEPFSEEQFLKKAREFDKNERFKEYVALYERVISAGDQRD